MASTEWNHSSKHPCWQICKYEMSMVKAFLQNIIMHIGPWLYGKWAITDRICQDLKLLWTGLLGVQRTIRVKPFKFPGSFGNVYGRDISPVHHHALSLTTKASAAGILHKISVILPLTRRFSQFSRLSQIGEFLSLAHVQSDYIAWNHVEYILWRKKIIFFKTLLKRPNSSLAYSELR